MPWKAEPVSLRDGADASDVPLREGLKRIRHEIRLELENLNQAGEIAAGSVHLGSRC
jgi:hypothetical protein